MLEKLKLLIKPNKRKMFWVLFILLIVLGFTLTLFVYFGGQMATWDMITNEEKDLRDLYSNQTQSQLSQWLPNGEMNFTEGLIWQSHLVKFDMNRPLYENVPQVLKNGKGACGENALVYGAFCVAKNITFRLVTVGYFFPGVVDHAWIQVNPSGDGKNWVQIDVADTCAGLQKGNTTSELWGITMNNNSYYAAKNYKMVLAYQLNENNEVMITDVTSTFSPKN